MGMGKEGRKEGRNEGRGGREGEPATGQTRLTGAYTLYPRDQATPNNDRLCNPGLANPVRN
jgi:hypothetical protein